MEIDVAVRLIEKGVDQKPNPQVWADLGSGIGLFTEALSTRLAPSSLIFAIDRDPSALSKVKCKRSDILLRKMEGDFTIRIMELADPLDGVIMANSLHFIAEKSTFIGALRKKLKPSGKLLLVEYDMDKSNPWVPYPISFSALTTLARQAGFGNVTKIGEEPSAYNRANLYAAVLVHNAAS